MARDILRFEYGGGGSDSDGKSYGSRRSSKYGFAGDVFFGKDDMKEYAWDGVYTEETVRFLERESAMKTLRKRSRKRRPETSNCFEFLKFVWCFKF